MALQINATTVVDDNKNIISGTPSTQGTIVKSTVSYLAPSGATGQRPTGAVGSIFFDTTEGKLVVHNGSDWA